MEWILILVTFYQPNVEIKITEIEFETSRECLATMEKYEEEFIRAADEQFSWHMRCERRVKE